MNKREFGDMNHSITDDATYLLNPYLRISTEEPGLVAVDKLPVGGDLLLSCLL